MGPLRLGKLGTERMEKFDTKYIRGGGRILAHPEGTDVAVCTAPV